MFSVLFWSFIPTANNFRPPRPTKKGDPGPVGLKTHAKDSESEKGIGGAGSRRGATLTGRSIAKPTGR